jgi:hypothetical protein
MTYLLRFLAIGVLVACGIMFGCAGRPSILPNPDPQLRKSAAQFAADAAKRHPYNADAPRGGDAPARAQVGYMLDRLEVVNLSNEQWNDVEVWVNQKYVVHIDKMEPNKLKQFNFQMLFDENGNYFPRDNSKTRVSKVEIFRDGKMYNVPLQLAD